MVIQGPVSNTMENVERAADSVICGAELALNQTRQLLQRAANPLLRESICQSIMLNKSTMHLFQKHQHLLKKIAKWFWNSHYINLKG